MTGLDDRSQEGWSFSGTRPHRQSWIGLVGSSLAVLCGAVLILALMAAAMFGVSVAKFGYAHAIQLVGEFDPSRDHDQFFFDQLNIAAGLAAYVALSTAVVLMARVSARGAWRDRIAWRPWNPFRDSRVFWALFALTLIYSLGADRVVTYLHPEAESWMPTPQGVTESILFVVLAAVLAPVGEELFFRGWIYTGLKGLSGVPVAITLSAALFALAHWEATHLYALVIFPIGLVLGFIRERTGSTKASIGFHALYNGFAAILLLTK